LSSIDSDQGCLWQGLAKSICNFPEFAGPRRQRNELYALIAAALSPIGSPLKYFSQEFNSLSEGWPAVRVVQPRLHDPVQKVRGTAALHDKGSVGMSQGPLGPVQVEVTCRLMPCQCTLKRREWTRLVLVFPNKLCSKSVRSILGES